MTGDNRTEAEKVRQALGAFLDRLAKAVADGLARLKRAGHLTRCRSGKSQDDGTKTSE